MNLPSIPTLQVKSLVQDINRLGFATISAYLQGDDLMRMQTFVSGAIDRSAREYVHFNGPDSVSGSGLDELGRAPEFIRLMHQIYEHGTGKPPIEQNFYQVLRCLSGTSGAAHSLNFHYDSYTLTALLPIQIPTAGRPGDLLMFPNTRNIRSSYVQNLADKALIDNPLTQRILRACVNTQRFAPARIQMQPGNLYVFWGYRSIHANEPCDPDKVRATALFHYANPHKVSFFRMLSKRRTARASRAGFAVRHLER